MRTPDRPLPDGVGLESGPVITVLPGQLYFGRGVKLKTLLGSCIGLTLWHPQCRLGGMCHFMLPGRMRRPEAPLDGRYGDEAIAALVDRIIESGTRTQDYVAHLYGGADTLPDASRLKTHVGERNIETAWALVEQHGFQLEGVDVGDNVPRSVTLDLQTGVVTMSRGTPTNSGRR